MNNCNQLRTNLERKKGQVEHIEKGIVDTKKEIRLSEKRSKRIEKAQLIIQTVAQQTQEQLEYRISELVSLALNAVFPDPYELELEFVLRRNKTEADLYLSKNGKRFDPLSSTGGGVIDIASFALRLALWALNPKRTSNVFIFDEPFRFLSKDLQPKAGQMLKEISSKLGIQIILVSHNEAIIGEADKIFRASMCRKKTVIAVE